MCIITISREYGAGGHPIGKQVAQTLGIEIYDKDILRKTVRDSGLDAGVIQREEEEISRADAIWRMITPAAYVDRREAIHQIESKEILALANRGPCVILGRCADAVLEDTSLDVLNVFIYANDIHRAVRISELIGSKNPSDIQRAMKRTDTARRAYYQSFTGKRWGDMKNYNLALDSGLLGYETCVNIICEAARSLDARQAQ